MSGGEIPDFLDTIVTQEFQDSRSNKIFFFKDRGIVSETARRRRGNKWDFVTISDHR